MPKLVDLDEIQKILVTTKSNIPANIIRFATHSVSNSTHYLAVDNLPLDQPVLCMFKATASYTISRYSSASPIMVNGSPYIPRFNGLSGTTQDSFTVFNSDAWVSCVIERSSYAIYFETDVEGGISRDLISQITARTSDVRADKKFLSSDGAIATGTGRMLQSTHGTFKLTNAGSQTTYTINTGLDRIFCFFAYAYDTTNKKYTMLLSVRYAEKSNKPFTPSQEYSVCQVNSTSIPTFEFIPVPDPDAIPAPTTERFTIVTDATSSFDVSVTDGNVKFTDASGAISTALQTLTWVAIGW